MKTKTAPKTKYTNTMKTALIPQAKIIEMLDCLDRNGFNFEDRNTLKDFYFQLGVKSVNTESKQKGNKQ